MASRKPPGQTASQSFPVSIQGNIQLFTNGINDSTFVDFDDPRDHQVFIYCWIDQTRGKGTHVGFEAGQRFSDLQGVSGSFELGLPFRQQDPCLLKVMCCMRMLDEQSQNFRTITFGSGAIDMTHLMRGGEQKIIMTDAMVKENQAVAVIRASNASDYGNHPDCRRPNAPTLAFSRSALWDIPLFNQEVDSVSEAIQTNSKKNGMGIPPGGGPFSLGVTDWEFSGADLTSIGKGVIPPLKTHYALMGSQEESLTRVLPVGLVVYHLYLKIYHSGMTMASILKLDKGQFGQFYAQAMQITCDAALTPYERDFVPAFGFSFSAGISLVAMGTENMALPCGAPQYLGRALRAVKALQVKPGTSLNELLALIESSSFPEFHTGVLCDDCESTAELATLVRKTLLTVPDSADELRALLADWSHLFGALTPECWKGLSAIINLGNDMLRSGFLTVVTGVGIATNASASQIEKNDASYNGHCFNVGCVQAPLIQVGADMEQGAGDADSPDGRASCFLLEGTSSMIHYRVDSHSPRITLNVCRGPERNVFKPESMDIPTACSMLGVYLSSVLRLVNAPKGGMPEGGGWPTRNQKLTGWLGHLMVMHSLDSDPDTHLSFYNRLMYMGWPCVPEAQGCMPVEERNKALIRGVADIPDHAQFVMGCHPYSLNDVDLRGVNATVSADRVDLMKRVMNEAHPPMVDHSFIRELSTYWAPCVPLEDVNVQAQAMREKGVEYLRVSSMETPGAPELIPVFYEAKRQAIRRANQINMAKHNSDGMIGSVEKLGTGVHVFLDVPLRNTPEATYVESLKQALIELQWPGFVPH